MQRHILATTATLLTCLLGATPAQALYLNIDNTTVAVGAATTDGSFNNSFDGGQTIDKAIDAPSADAEEFHTQSTHIWFTADSPDGSLELEFDFGLDVDITTLHFWNYTSESYDVDSILVSFFDSDGALISNVAIQPALGSSGGILAQDIALGSLSGVRTATAVLSATNGQIDFQNIGFSDTPLPPPSTYLNIDNITVSVGDGTSEGTFNNTFSGGQTINKVIDAPSADAEEFHNQTTHIWHTTSIAGGGLELLFDFGQPFDITTIHFWNYTGESFDVDDVAFEFFDNNSQSVGTLTIFPDLGSSPGIAAQNIPLGAPLNIQFVRAFLRGSNGQVDFQNIGFSANLSTPDDDDNDGVGANSDNCIEVANADQRDTDDDGFGNVCDADLDNDCVVNFVDLGIMRQVFFTADENADLNGDGATNFVDLGILRESFFNLPGPSGVAGCQ